MVVEKPRVPAILQRHAGSIRRRSARLGEQHARWEEVDEAQPQELRARHYGKDGDLGILEGHYQPSKRAAHPVSTPQIRMQ